MEKKVVEREGGNRLVGASGQRTMKEHEDHKQNATVSAGKHGKGGRGGDGVHIHGWNSGMKKGDECRAPRGQKKKSKKGDRNAAAQHKRNPVR